MGGHRLRLRAGGARRAASGVDAVGEARGARRGRALANEAVTASAEGAPCPRSSPRTWAASSARTQLTPYLEKITDREPYDRAGFDAELSRRGRRHRPPPGRDRARPHRRRRVQQGQLDHLLLRPRQRDRGAGDRPGGENQLPADLDREAFAEYYEGHDTGPGDRGRQAQRPRRARRARGRHRVERARASSGSARARSPTTARRSSATSPTSRRPLRHGRRRRRASSRWSRRRACTGWRTSTTTSDEEFVFALADALRVEYRAIVDAGLHAPGRRRRASGTSSGRCGCSAAATEDYRAGRSCASTRSTTRCEGIPPERVRYHVCCGSCHGAHTIDPSLATSSTSCCGQRAAPT